jgi:mono/diheme cytochrome c family protein
MQLFRTISIGLVALSLLALAQAGCQKRKDNSPVKLPGDSQQAKKQLTNAAVAPSRLPPRELYDLHCAACHGENGNAIGPGAQSVYPAPRNFRTEAFRLVSTQNRIASAADIERSISQGVPGTSMVAFDKLHPEDQQKITEVVMQLWREGLREQILADTAGDPPTAAQLDAEVLKLTTASEPQPVPADLLANGSIERGQQIYLAQSCQSCHGTDGRGNPDLEMFDNNGQSIRPRDLVNETMKGGADPSSIYLRLKLGMPGTPHPGSDNLDDQQLSDLVAYVISLAAEKKVIMTGFQRRSLSQVRDYLQEINHLPREL